MPYPAIIRYVAGCALALPLLCSTASTSQAVDIWYEDNNMGKGGGVPPDFVEKFRQPESFDEASGYIDVYLLRANVLEKMDDAFFTDLLLPYLAENDIKLAIDAGGANWTQASERRRAVSDAQVELLDRIKRLGGRVDYLSLQSVLSKPLKSDPSGYPLDKRIEDVVNFSIAARSVFPDVDIGIIDALPAKGEDYEEPYRLAHDALAKAGIGLSHIHLDISFDAPRTGRFGVTWDTIREIESFVEDDLDARFGLYAKSRRAGQTSDKMFHRRVMDTLECYAGAGGTPNEYILASWFPHPQRTIPESATGDDYPNMRTVLEFGRQLEEIESQGPSLEEGDRRWQRTCEARLR